MYLYLRCKFNEIRSGQAELDVCHVVNSRCILLRCLNVQQFACILSVLGPVVSTPAASRQPVREKGPVVRGITSIRNFMPRTNRLLRRPKTKMRRRNSESFPSLISSAPNIQPIVCLPPVSCVVVITLMQPTFVSLEKAARQFRTGGTPGIHPSSLQSVRIIRSQYMHVSFIVLDKSEQSTCFVVERGFTAHEQR